MASDLDQLTGMFDKAKSMLGIGANAGAEQESAGFLSQNSYMISMQMQQQGMKKWEESKQGGPTQREKVQMENLIGPSKSSQQQMSM